MTKFDKTIDVELLQKVLNSPFKENLSQLILESDLKTEKYLLETQKRFSSSPEQMKKVFDF